MRTEENKKVYYSYSYVTAVDNCTDVISKLPKISMKLPKINLSENLNLVFC